MATVRPRLILPFVLGAGALVSLLLQAGSPDRSAQHLIDIADIVLAVGYAALWFFEIARTGAFREALRQRRIEFATLVGFLLFLVCLPFLPDFIHRELSGALHEHARELAMGAVRFFLFVCVALQALRIAGAVLSRGIRPDILLTISFVLIIGAGAVLLGLPAACAEGASPIRWIDAFFTSTSAVCVTGLTVRDTGTDFSTTGQTILLGLIQLGGLGIVTFIALVSSISNRRLPVAQMAVFRNLTNATESENLRRRVLAVFAITLLVEIAGAAALFISNPSPGGWLDRAGWAVFHSVSAFCNAGFALQTDSMEAYSGNLPLNLTIMALVVLGGLGFLVIPEQGAGLVRSARRLLARLGGQPVPRPRPLSLQSWLALNVTLFLILGGAAGFYAIESGHLLRDAPEGVAWTSSFFQSVIARTAGFNSLPIGGLQNATLALLIILMVVGGSPVSTAGGIKTVTFAVLLLAIKALVTGRDRVELRGRTLPARVVISAINVFVLYAFSAALGVFALSLSDPGVSMRDTLFETISALSTVGLSTGITASLSDSGKIVLCVLMFVGRVGPIAIVLSVFQKRTPLNYDFPEEDVVVG